MKQKKTKILLSTFLSCALLCSTAFATENGLVVTEWDENGEPTAIRIPQVHRINHGSGIIVSSMTVLPEGKDYVEDNQDSVPTLITSGLTRNITEEQLEESSEECLEEETEESNKENSEEQTEESNKKNFDEQQKENDELIRIVIPSSPSKQKNSGNVISYSSYGNDEKTIAYFFDEKYNGYDIDGDPVLVSSGLISEDEPEENEEIELHSPLDLSISKLEAASNLVAHEESYFDYRIQVSGSGTAYNLEVDIELDGKKIGTDKIGTLKNNQDRYFAISNVREGKHTIKLIIDSQNKVTAEENKSNNTFEKTFTWNINSNALPDLVINIESPKQSQGLKGEDRNSCIVCFTNAGYAPVTVPFDILFKLDGSEQETIHVDSMPSRYSNYLIYDIVTPEAYGTATFEFEIDYKNTVKESNENNNTCCNTYDLVYCTHRGEFSSRGQNSNITIWCDPAIFGKTGITCSKDIALAAKQWNGIVDQVKFVDIVETTPEKMFSKSKAGDVLIRYATEEDNINWSGGTNKDSKTLAVTKQRKNASGENIKVIFCHPDNWDANQRSLIHELGHCLGLGHVNNEGDHCEKRSIMRKSDDESIYKADKVMPHDMYNVKYFN